MWAYPKAQTRKILLLVICAALSANLQAAKPAFERINWSDLIPEQDAAALKAPPKALAEIEDGSAEDVSAGKLGAADLGGLNDTDYARALRSQNVVNRYIGQNIALPGYLVPLEFNEQQTLTAFFLVPYYGACLHLPAPPPNQIVYAQYDSKVGLENLYDPFLLKGTLHTSITDNELGTSAYTLTVKGIEPFKP